MQSPLKVRRMVLRRIVLALIMTISVGAGFVQAARLRAAAAPLGAVPLAAVEHDATFGRPVKQDVSPRIRDLIGADTATTSSAAPAAPPNAPAAMPGVTVSWDGLGYAQGASSAAQPDPSGEAGLTSYVQLVGSAYRVWTKTGTAQTSVIPLSTLWSGVGNLCETNIAGGSAALIYDQLADRWVIMHTTTASNSQNYLCLAISTTSDPTGTWNRAVFASLSGEYVSNLGSVCGQMRTTLV